MSRADEFTPLLVSDDDVTAFQRRRRRSVWQLVLVGALSLGVLSLIQQREGDSVPVEIKDITVSFDADPSEAGFLSSMETFKDPSVDPCVDFYQYACGGWLQQHEIPSDRPAIDSSFYVVSESNKDTIRRIFDQGPPQIGPFYQSCLNGQDVDADAVAFVAQLIESVHRANSTLALMTVAGEVDQSLGISTFFSWGVGADPRDPSNNVLQFAQGGLTLPSREYYLQEDKVEAYAALFVDYVTKLFAVGDLDRHNASEYAEAVLETETKLAEISLPNAALRNPWTTSTAYPFAEIAQRYPFLMAYLNGIYGQEPFPMLEAIVATPTFFEAQNELLRDEALLPQLKNYLSFHLIDSFGAVLGEYFRRTSHEFHGKIQGAGALLPRGQFCERLTTSFLGDELGEYYMKDVFGPDAKAAAQALVTEIEESLKALLTTEAWLDKVTYEAAVAKLDKVKNFIGGPDDVEPLPFELQADAFFNNVKSLMQRSAAATIEAIDKPVDEQAWDMFPSTVNAYYDPSANKMVFPAAILQPPFYSAENFPAAANFARIGMVMGHELSHGFDDQGRNFDGDGALRSWWTPSVSAEFAEKAQCLAAQYSTFPVVSIDDGHVLGTVNGNLTLGENIADNGGIHLAYEAYQLWKSTFALPPNMPPTEVPAPPPEEAPKPVETAPTVPPPEEKTPEPAVIPAPVAPIPDVPVPEPTETGPGELIPVTTLPPAVLPVPDAENPEPVQTEPSGEIPVATPSPPEVVPEPEPTEIGPGQVIPEETSPAPTVVTPPPPTASIPTTVPDEPTPPEVQTPEPSATPSETKHKHMKERDDDGEDKEKRHRYAGSEGDEEESKRHKKHDEDQDSKRESGRHGDKERRHEDEGTHRAEKRERDDDDRHSRREHESRRERHADKNDERESRRERHEDKHDERDEERRHEDEGNEGTHRAEKRERDDDDRHSRREHESRRERHEDKHDERDEEHGRHGKGGQLQDPEEEDRHDRRESKEERREERKERHEERRKEHKERREERKERHEERREERKERHEERRKERKERHEEESEEKHNRHEDREDRWDECGDCEREEHNRHDHDEDWDEESERHGCGREGGCGSKRHRYPFSGGDAKIHSMVERMARAIAQPSDPIADDRLFFTAFAQNWCEKRSPAYAELLRTIDPHSPGKWRVNGPLMNYNKFAEAFSCPLGTPMNPEKKCVIW